MEVGGGGSDVTIGGGGPVTIEELFTSVAVAETLIVVLLSRFKLFDWIDGFS